MTLTNLSATKMSPKKMKKILVNRKLLDPNKF